MRSKLATILVGVFIGIVLMVTLNTFTTEPTPESKTEEAKEKKPLYWVAPMDANYRRNGPGQSPMGMDLIPFYGESDEGSESGPGGIRISPDVINNLGVKTTFVKRAQLHSEINTVGYIQYNEDQLIHIHPRVEGWIEKIHVKAAGDPVKKGQPLYEIYSPSLVNAQEELLLAINRKNQTLITASKQRLRSLQLPESTIKFITKNKKVQQNIVFYAPQSGVVDQLMIRQGMFVKPGNAIMSIGVLDQVWVEAEVFERQASTLKVGAAVSMSTDFIPGQSWRGKVDYIYPTLDAKTRTLKVRLIFDNEGNLLKPNMFTQVSIHSNSSDKLLLVPRHAVIRTGDSDRVVVVLENGKFKSIEVKVGRSNNEFIEVIQGLNADDEVVTSAQFLIDSESSKTSDFVRMNHAAKEISSATVEGVINSLMKDHGMINISREAIEKWNRPAATVDFVTQNQLDISKLEAGMKVEFTFEVSDGDFVITDIYPIDNL